jgi:hypothetical protein
MKSARSEAVAERIRALNSEMIVNAPPRPAYTPEEEALLEVLRGHRLVDPVFAAKWATGRCSPADIVAVLAGYGVKP